MKRRITIVGNYDGDMTEDLLKEYITELIRAMNDAEADTMINFWLEGPTENLPTLSVVYRNEFSADVQAKDEKEAIEIASRGGRDVVWRAISPLYKEYLESSSK